MCNSNGLPKFFFFFFLFYLGESNEDSEHTSYNADEGAHLILSQVTDEGYIYLKQLLPAMKKSIGETIWKQLCVQNVFWHHVALFTTTTLLELGSLLVTAILPLEEYAIENTGV